MLKQPGVEATLPCVSDFAISNRQIAVDVLGTAPHRGVFLTGSSQRA